jgi:transcription antitermination factor NusG
LSSYQTGLIEQPSANPLLSLGETCWFAIQTRPRFEKKVASQLEEKGIGVFLPLVSTRRQWSDRKQTVHLPLFPGYVFVRVASSLDTRILVLRTNGVHGFVCVRGGGSPIPEDEIRGVQSLIENRISVMPHPFLNVGQKVRIRGGSLDGVTGILTAVNGDQSLVLSVDLIQRSVAMRITGFDVQPI